MVRGLIVQVRERHDPDGTNKSTRRAQRRGQRIMQALLEEMGLGDYDAWLDANCDTVDNVSLAVRKVSEHFLKKLEAGEQWTNFQSGTRGDSVRDISHDAAKEMCAS
jgi:hypothetical protein